MSTECTRATANGRSNSAPSTQGNLVYIRAVGYISLGGKAIEIVTNALTGDGQAALHDTAVEITTQASGALVGSLFPVPNDALDNSTKEFLEASKEITKNISGEVVKKVAN